MPRTVRAWLAAALALTLAAGSARAATPARTLAGLEREWAAHVVTQRPHEARRLGLHPHADALVPVTEAWIAAERAWLVDFGARLGTLPTAGLARSEVARRDSIARVVEDWREATVVRRVWEREPAAYAALAGDAVEAALEGAHPCDAAHHATRRLALVPEVLRAARINLRDPSRAALEAGIERFARVLELYRVTLPARTEGCRDGYALAPLAEADTAAVRAVETFLASLHDDLRAAPAR